VTRGKASFSSAVIGGKWQLARVKVNVMLTFGQCLLIISHGGTLMDVL
jgi:hypothetical protein